MRGREDKQEQLMRARGYMTYQDVSDAVGVTTVAVGRWVTEGALKAVVLGNRRYLKRQDVVEYLGREAAEALGLVAGADPEKNSKATPPKAKRTAR